MLIITDLDGTLVDSKRAVARSTVVTLENFTDGKYFDEDFFKYLGVPIREVLKNFVLFEKLEESVTFFRSHLRDHGKSLTTVFPGVPESLEKLRSSGARVVVASNKVSSLSKAVLEQQGILELIDSVQGSNNHPPKPSPDMLISAKREFPNANSFMVGDRPEDILAGKAADLFTIQFSREFQRLLEEENISADKVVLSWPELASWLTCSQKG